LIRDILKTALDVQAPLIDEPIPYGHNVHLKVETDAAAAAVIGKIC